MIPALLFTALMALPAPQEAPVPPQAPPPADVFAFKSDAAVMFWVVKAAETESFDLVWGVIRTRLAASTNPQLKSLGDTMKVFRVGATPGATEVTYLFLADPASKTNSYSAAPFLLYESGLFSRPEAEELFKMLQTAIVRINPFPLDIVR